MNLSTSELVKCVDTPMLRDMYRDLRSKASRVYGYNIKDFDEQVDICITDLQLAYSAKNYVLAASLIMENLESEFEENERAFEENKDLDSGVLERDCREWAMEQKFDIIHEGGF